jgi:hypothetical protein
MVNTYSIPLEAQSALLLIRHNSSILNESDRGNH